MVLCGPHEQDTDSLTDCITDYINMEGTNIKPWVTPDWRAVLLGKKKEECFQSDDREIEEGAETS